MERRQFLRLACGGLVGASAACVAGPAWAWLLEPSWLSREQVRVRLKNLAPSLRELRIVFLSDLHRGPYVDSSHIGRAVRMAQKASPDLVLLGGDFVSQSAAYAESCARELARLQAPLGVYACLGNHDYWTDRDAVTEALRRAGIRVLRNAGLEVADRLWVAAVDDVWEGRPSLETALRGMPTDALAVLLAHEPDYADTVAADGRIALMLSGHTHGGQVHLPLFGPPILPYLGQRYPAGLYSLGEMTLYVTRGVGLVAPPIRLNCRPEISVLVLEQSVAA